MRRPEIARRGAFGGGVLTTVVISVAAYFISVSLVVSPENCYSFRLTHPVVATIASVPFILNGMALFWLAAVLFLRRRAARERWIAPVIGAWAAPLTIDVVTFLAASALSNVQFGGGVGGASGAGAIILLAGAVVILLTLTGIACNVWALLAYPAKAEPDSGSKSDVGAR
jgi:hypothetical protein